MNADLLFATPLYMFEISNASSMNSKLEKQAVEMSTKDKGLILSNVKGWHSDVDLQMNPDYKDIIDFIKASSIEVCKARGLKDSYFPFIKAAWFNINKKGAFNRKHTHPWCMFSGVYYVKTPENCGDLIIDDPRAVEVHNPLPDVDKTKLPIFFKPAVSIKPVAGRLYIFPSYVPHSVDPNESDEDRISIAFNITIKSY